MEGPDRALTHDPRQGQHVPLGHGYAPLAEGITIPLLVGILDLPNGSILGSDPAKSVLKVPN